jgi:hypothetical protein
MLAISLIWWGSINQKTNKGGNMKKNKNNKTNSMIGVIVSVAKSAAMVIGAILTSYLGGPPMLA